MEDAVIKEDRFPAPWGNGDDKGALFAVLDGHGGEPCSKFCAGESDNGSGYFY